MILDTGVLISAEWNDRPSREFLALIRRNGVRVVTTEAVIAQVVRSPPQVHLHRFLGAAVSEVVPLDHGRRVGALLTRSETSDVVDAHLVELARRRRESVLTGDVDDLRHIAQANDLDVDIVAWP